MEKNRVQCREELTRGAITIFCLKPPDHRGWHWNDGFWWEEESERTAFENAGKFNKAGEFRWPPKE